jgi:hypothetical protein
MFENVFLQISVILGLAAIAPAAGRLVAGIKS